MDQRTWRYWVLDKKSLCYLEISRSGKCDLGNYRSALWEQFYAQVWIIKDAVGLPGSRSLAEKMSLHLNGKFQSLIIFFFIWRWLWGNLSKTKCQSIFQLNRKHDFFQPTDATRWKSWSEAFSIKKEHSQWLCDELESEEGSNCPR